MNAVSEYPEHEAMKKVAEESQAQGELLDWAEGEDLITLCAPIRKILAKYHGIDLDRIEAEKRQMLAELRAHHDHES